MILEIQSMPDCCWKYLHGINHKKINLQTFQLACLRAFRNTDYLQSKGWHCADSFTGAVLFCAAHSGDAMAIYGDTVSKKIVLDSLEKVCSYVEDEDIGHIVELPQFTNSAHDSKIVPRMWIINQGKFKIALNRWNDNSKINKAYKDMPRW